MNKHISIVFLWLSETSQIPFVCTSTDAFDDGNEKYVVNKLHLAISFCRGYLEMGTAGATTSLPDETISVHRFQDGRLPGD